MARRRFKLEEIVTVLRQPGSLHGRDMTMADAVR